MTITSTAQQATDLGYLLHKNPANLHTLELPFGKAHVFYSCATSERTTACLVVDVNPVELVRGARQLEDYVNDRPYAASSYLTVALGRVFGTALAGNCAKRPELVGTRLPLEITVEVVRSRGGPDVLKRLFEPLGYVVAATGLTLDEQFPDWGESPYCRLQLRASVTVHDALSHLYVLLPVLDGQKHYYIAGAEVDKLMRHGEGWLQGHPERRLIVQRYLKRRASLVDEAFARLQDDGVEDDSGEQPAAVERELERPMTLHTQRISLVAARLRELGAASVVDLGCGEGRLLRRLLADRGFVRIVGMDVSHRALEVASSRLRLNRMAERERKRILLIQGSLLYRDRRLSGFDGAALVEVIEHLDPPRLAAMERVVFDFARPRHVVVTTPNREYNVLFAGLAEGRLRHPDHRFEWTRAEFAAWARAVAGRFGYQVSFEDVGPADEQHGAPSRMAVFSLSSGGAA
ncbi:MAG: 3' terminal RNA ribose 2'-O-methyltransferase Hen1 [Bryobacteraceae bacterium]|nr:3' terminal RNA ribose 2'-O-methyltransferase Hen1 [Bryobacteraceae bacterium]